MYNSLNIKQAKVFACIEDVDWPGTLTLALRIVRYVSNAVSANATNVDLLTMYMFTLTLLNNYSRKYKLLLDKGTKLLKKNVYVILHC